MVQRNIEPLDDLAEFIQERVTGRSFDGAFELARPEAQANIFSFHALFFVHDIVRGAAPSVDDVDCVALRLWEKKKRVIKIASFVLFDYVGNKEGFHIL